MATYDKAYELAREPKESEEYKEYQGKPNRPSRPTKRLCQFLETSGKNRSGLRWISLSGKEPG